MKKECIFCWMNVNSTFDLVLQETASCYAVRDNFPVTQGHTLIIPKHHIDHWFMASKTIQQELIDLLQDQKDALDDLYSPEGYNVGFNCSPIAGQTILHLHLHLIPRYRGDTLNPEGGVRGVIQNKQKYQIF